MLRHMKLRELRQKKGWTQERLSAASGVDQPTISNLEHGRIKSPSFNVISRLAKALGVDPDDIVSTSGKARAAAR